MALSHPSVGSLLQSSHPDAHALTHVSLWQDATSLCGASAVQSMQLAPQRAGSLLAQTFPQRNEPPMHTKSQTPLTHVACPLVGTGHCTLQPPQWSARDAVTTHSLPHWSSPGGHAVTHENPPSPLAQSGAPSVHAAPQPPHDAGLLRAVSHPLSGLSSQSEKPDRHVCLHTRPDALPAQCTEAACAVEHAMHPGRPQPNAGFVGSRPRVCCRSRPGTEGKRLRSASLFRPSVVHVEGAVRHLEEARMFVVADLLDAQRLDHEFAVLLC